MLQCPRKRMSSVRVSVDCPSYTQMRSEVKWRRATEECIEESENWRSVSIHNSDINCRASTGDNVCKLVSQPVTISKKGGRRLLMTDVNQARQKDGRRPGTDHDHHTDVLQRRPNYKRTVEGKRPREDGVHDEQQATSNKPSSSLTEG